MVVVGGWVLCFSRLTPSAVSLSMNGAQQLHQETRMIRGNRERTVFDLFSILKCVRSKGFFGEPLGSSENLTWANFDDRPLLSLPFPSFLLLLLSSPCVRPKKPPCVDSKRLRVYVQDVPVCTDTTPACGSTCARGAGTHGDVLNLHTEVFSACHTTHHTHHTHTATHTATHTTHTNTHNTQTLTYTHHNTRRQTDRQSGQKLKDEREDERRETTRKTI